MRSSVMMFMLLFLSVTAVNAEDGHAGMEHSMHTMQGAGLTEAGNDAFGTIQEVITRLNADPETDWSRVNIEALRQHLVDMHDMTINVEVLEQKPVDNGLQVLIKPTTKRAAMALARVFSAHPAQLQRESGWTMQVKKDGDVYKLHITTTRAGDIDKIRGLGYIGLMAYGNHHQPHHWAMATGKNPHAHH